MTDRTTLHVALGPRSYDVLVGSGLLEKAGPILASLVKLPRVMVITDENVAEYHLSTLKAALKAADIESHTIVFPPGEKTKGFPHLERLIEALLDSRIERKTTLVALGGGVIGDLVGFAASIVLRGVDFVQIPTTLLAQVDSSVGGKTGINTRHGKNLVGTFYQPRLVLADITTLDTLPRRELLAGYAEVLKYALVRDPDFFQWLDDHGAALRDGDHAARHHAVVTSCRAKAAIVAEDERETGLRALLNFGHTFGHALEAEIGYGSELLHGEAVAIGMMMAFDLSVRLGLCPKEDATRVRRHMEDIGLPTSLHAIGGHAIGERDWDVSALLSHMRQDKKVEQGKVTFVLTHGIGDAFLSSDVCLEMVGDVIKSAVAA